jgi:hypothetical protein
MALGVLSVHLSRFLNTCQPTMTTVNLSLDIQLSCLAGYVLTHVVAICTRLRTTRNVYNPSLHPPTHTSAALSLDNVQGRNSYIYMHAALNTATVSQLVQPIVSYCSGSASMPLTPVYRVPWGHKTTKHTNLGPCLLLRGQMHCELRLLQHSNTVQWKELPVSM